MRDIQYKAWYRGHMYDRVNLRIEPDYTAVEIVKGRGDNVHTDTEKAKLLQYTGLRDMNGKMIFESDILQHPQWLEQEVVFKYGSFGLEVKGINFLTDGFNSFATVSADYKNCMVIGNIYEHPHLLNKNE